MSVVNSSEHGSALKAMRARRRAAGKDEDGIVQMCEEAHGDLSVSESLYVSTKRLTARAKESVELIRIPFVWCDATT